MLEARGLEACSCIHYQLKEVNMKQRKRAATAKDKPAEKGWKVKTPDTTKKEKRSLDIGESGQFAPGGYYNQQRATAPGRSRLDELVPDENIEKSMKTKK
jgi:hypothetical protein